MNRVLRLAALGFGIWLVCSIGIVSLARYQTKDAYLIVISSNIRDNDQALYLATPKGVLLKKLTQFPGGEIVYGHSSNGKWLVFRSNVNINYYSLNIMTNDVREIADGYSQFIQMSPKSEWTYFFSQTPDQRYERAIYRIALWDGNRRELVRSEQGFYRSQFSPDNEWLYIMGDYLIRLHVPTETVETLPYSLEGISYQIIGWSPNEEWIYIGQSGNNGSSFVFRVQTENETREDMMSGFGRFIDAYTSPDGKWLLIRVRGSQANYFYRINLHTDDPPVAIGGGTVIGWSPDGASPLVTRQNDNGVGIVCLLDIEANECEAVVENVSQFLAWSPNHNQFVFSRRNLNNELETILVDADGRNEYQLGGGSHLEVHGWSPDGEWLYFEDQINGKESLYRVNSATGQRETVHEAYEDNNHHDIFQTFLPLYPAETSHSPILIFVGILFGMGSMFAIPQRWRKTG